MHIARKMVENLINEGLYTVDSVLTLSTLNSCSCRVQIIIIAED